MNDLAFGLWIVIIFTLLYEPIVGYISFQKFRVTVKKNKEARSNYYKFIMIGLWIPTIFILLLVIFTELNLNHIGITLPIINTDTLGPLSTYVVLIVALFYLCIILYYFVGYYMSDKIRDQLMQAKEKELSKEGFSEIIPITKKEKKLWNYVSLTAGITEEIIYRGFLIFAFSYIFPNYSIWFIILFASLLFGFAHTYQGLSGVVKTTIVGALFSMLYIGLNSILPIIIFHFLIDLVAKLGDPETPK